MNDLTRRDFLKLCGISAAALAFGQPARSAPTPRPNILYILCDDLGYGDLSGLNPQSKIATPNIDRLAAAGG